MKSRFGIVIRAYNVGKYIEKAVNRVLAQTFTDWTAVIVDDGSEDDTKYIEKKTVGRDSRFQVLEINRGGASLQHWKEWGAWIVNISACLTEMTAMTGSIWKKLKR